jgi:tetratricopeptide (TPR) repeat protein
LCVAAPAKNSCKISKCNRRFLETIGTVATISEGAPDADRTGWSFAQLLDWHLTRGTRAKGSPDVLGKHWTNAEFAGEVSSDERTVRNWRRGRRVPNAIIVIERRLFGEDNPAYDLWCAELREAHQAARASQRGDGSRGPVSNIPIRVPIHFMGRDDALAEIEAALKRYEGRVAITALHGLRGIGKTTLAVAYAEQHRRDYRASWWIRAQADSTMRADLVALGIRLGWVRADDKQDTALAAVMERLRHEGEGILLVFDNVIDADALKPYLPRGGGAQVLVTSNAHAWRGVATPVEIRLWPKEIGADYLVVRTGRETERTAAEALSLALGGLPLAHEQAAAYCERLDVSLAEYRKRFEATPARLLDDARHAPVDYHDGLTVAKTFALAIEEAAKLHPAAESLIVHAALLAPEPIPLFLFSEVPEKFGEPLASMLLDDGLDEAVAALRAFSLIDHEAIKDERDASITTETIRLHRLVREVTAGRCDGEVRDHSRRALVAALAVVYPRGIYTNLAAWPRCELLTPHVLAICEIEVADTTTNTECADLLGRAGAYFHSRANYSLARPLLERSLAIREKVSGPEHPDTALSLHNLGGQLQDQGDYAAARRLLERALAIREKVSGPEHPDTVMTLNGLARLLQVQGDLAGARPLFECGLAITEKTLGPEHQFTSMLLNNLAQLLQAQGDFAGARPLFERALAISEKEGGPGNLTAFLNNLAKLLQAQGDFAGARPLLERSLSIAEKALGLEHPDTSKSLNNLARLLQAQGDFAAARPLLERSLSIAEKALGVEHPDTAMILNNLGTLLQAQRDLVGARTLLERSLAIREKVSGPKNPETAVVLSNLAVLLEAQGNFAGARPLFERALAIREQSLGPEHLDTAASLSNLGTILLDQGDLIGARPLLERSLAIREKVRDRELPDTAMFLNTLAILRQTQGDPAVALPLYERALAIREKVSGPEHPDTAQLRDNILRLKLATLPRNQGDPTTWGNVRRNELCPCGSAKRYKHCHGSVGPSLSVQTRRDLT